MRRFLKSQAIELARQAHAAIAELHKADITPQEAAEVAAVLASIDFSGWAILVGDVEPIMEEIVRSQSIAALAQVGIDVEARPEVMKIVNERAIAYAKERGAELVGMRRTADGKLVPNPRAEWRITESTRDFMRADVAQAIDEGWGFKELSKALSNAYGFSSERSDVIARTELNFAASTGAMEGYRASGVVTGKVWLTAEDDKVSEECQANGDAGEIGLDEDFPSGDDAPPVHPNCRCAVAPVTDLDRKDAQ
jgi:SPP1 gp7 family putative phage head morphogenesis protein